MNSDMMVKYIEFVADRQFAVLPRALPLRHVHVPEGDGPGSAADISCRARVYGVGVCLRGVLLPNSSADTRGRCSPLQRCSQS